MDSDQEEALRSARLRVRRLSDEELRHSTLSTTDPLGLPNLCSTPPEGQAELVCEMAYRASYDMRCVFGHRHKTGFIFLDDEGKRYPVGKDCGLKKFGLDWATIMNAHESQTARQSYLLRLDALGAAITAEMPRLREMRDAIIYETVHQTQRSMLRNAPSLFEACRRAAEQGGVLLVTVQVRDFKAEERVKERNEKAKHDYGQMSDKDRQAYLRKYGPIRDRIDPVYTSEQQAWGLLAGWSWFVKGELIAARIRDFVEKLEIFLASPALSAKTADLKAMAMGIEELLEAFQRTMDELDAPSQFFDPSNVLALCNWANEVEIDGHPYSVRGRDIYGTDADGQPKLVAQSLQIEKPDDTPLRRIREAVRAVAS